MYEVDPSRWIRVATMHFSGRVVGWLQAVGRRVRFWSWSEFCAQIHSRFGHDQHQSLIRRLFHIRQTGSVLEYVEPFSVLVDHQSAYEENVDPLYYTMCFIDGLHDDIKSVIMVPRPSTLDTACSLALVQEEALASGRWRCGASLIIDLCFHTTGSSRDRLNGVNHMTATRHQVPVQILQRRMVVRGGELIS